MNKINLRLLLGLTSALFCISAHAQFICNSTPEVYALEVVKMELAGRRSPLKSECMNQDRFKYVRAAHDPLNELVGQDFLYADASTLKIEEVERVNDDLGHYRVDFSVQAGVEKAKMQRRKDSLFFSLRRSGKWGCAQVLFSPEDLYIDSQCR